MSTVTLEPKVAPVRESHKDPAAQFERYDTIDTPRIVVIGFVSAILTFTVILAAQAVFFSADRAEVARKANVAVPSVLTNGWTQQQNRLAGYGWVDPSRGIVSIPIQDAMRRVVEEHKAPTANSAVGE